MPGIGNVGFKASGRRQTPGLVAKPPPRFMKPPVTAQPLKTPTAANPLAFLGGTAPGNAENKVR